VQYPVELTIPYCAASSTTSFKNVLVSKSIALESAFAFPNALTRDVRMASQPRNLLEGSHDCGARDGVQGREIQEEELGLARVVDTLHARRETVRR